MAKLTVDLDKAVGDGFQAAIASRHRASLKTSEALRKVVLITTKADKQTELDDFPKGQIDPQMQLLLIARDEFQNAEDPTTKLGFYKSMREVYLSMDKRIMDTMQMVMTERHHNDKLEILAKAANASEPTQAEVDAAIGAEE